MTSFDFACAGECGAMTLVAMVRFCHRLATMTGCEEIGMTGLPDCRELANFKELVDQAMDVRLAVQQQNLGVRESIEVAVQAAHQEKTPWAAYPPDDEIAGNVSKRLNVSCGDAFRMHLVIEDGGRVVFPKAEAAEAFIANGSAEALHEIARRYALNRMPVETVIARRGMQAR